MEALGASSVHAAAHSAAEAQTQQGGTNGDAKLPVAEEDSEQQGLSEQDMDAMIAEALDCPCVADLRASECGRAFEAAFTCFHKSNDLPKGLNCVDANLAFAECLRQHPEALAAMQSGGEGGAFAMPDGPLPDDG